MNLKQKVVGTAHLLVTAILTSFVVLVADFPAAAMTPLDNKCELVSGDGTAASPYLLSNSLELREAADCDSDTRVFEIRTDIVIPTSEAASWPQLGTTSRLFKGTVRGNVPGKPRATITIEDGGELQGSLFGVTGNLTISDLVVAGDIGTGSLGNVSIGAFAQDSRGSTRIVNSLTYVNVNGVGSGVGSFVGQVSLGVLTIDSSSARVSEAQGYVQGGIRTGGLVGHVALGSTLKIHSSSSLVRLSSSGQEIGGLVGRSQGTVEIIDSFFAGSIRSSTSIKAGGLAGGLDGSGGAQATFLRSFAKTGIFSNNVTSLQLGGILGGASGNGANVQISESFAIVHIEGPAYSNTPRIGGVVGNVSAGAELLVEDSYASGRFSVSGQASVTDGIAGLVGAVSSPSTYSFLGENYFNEETLAGAGGTHDTGTRQSLTGGTEVALSSSQFSDSANFPSWAPSFTFGLNPCLQNLPESCETSFMAGRLAADGRTILLHSETELSSNLGSTSDFNVLSDGSSLVVDSVDRVGASSVELVLNQEVQNSSEVRVSYTKPGSGGFESSSSPNTQLDSRLFLPVANFSSITGPTAALANPTASPTTIEIGLTCGGSCGSADSYNYVASITPAGGSPTTISGTANSMVTTLSFTALTPSVSHTIQASVTNNDQTSATVSTTVETLRPTATISALTVADISANLTVGCTNCGADPDSFVITATPEGGGAAITSTTNPVTGLTPETTYSFAVVITFAGVDSDSVNWQDNPVMTLPFVPIISSVSPAALPISGGTVTVTGSNFSTSNEVTVDGATVSFTIVNGTTITFTAPQKTAGDYAIAITNLVGTNTLANAIRFVSGPFLSTNSPLVGTANGGTIVTLTGTDLGTASQVELRSATVSFSVLSETAIRFVTPAHTSALFDMSASAVMNIKVTTVGGTATLTNGFEYTTSALVPVVSGVTPLTGPIAGGTTITVTGQYFSGSYSDSVSAAINGVSGSSIVLIDDSTLTFVSPPGAAATGLDVTIATGGGLGTLAGAFSYTAPPAPTAQGSAPSVAITTPMIVEFSTREIAASGAQVTATGQRLEGISVLTLGGMTLTIVSNTATSITFTTGEMPLGVWDLRLVGSNGTLVFQQAIEVVEATSIVAESTGELLGYTWTFKFLGNSRSLHQAQEVHLNRRMSANSQAETIICWGYTTAQNPNAWAIAHATQRAQAACNLVAAANSEVKTVVRLRYGVQKNWAMRSAVQFWR